MPITEEHRRRRSKNLALAWFLGFLVVLFFLVTLAKMGAWS